MKMQIDVHGPLLCRTSPPIKVAPRRLETGAPVERAGGMVRLFDLEKNAIRSACHRTVGQACEHAPRESTPTTTLIGTHAVDAGPAKTERADTNRHGCVFVAHACIDRPDSAAERLDSVRSVDGIEPFAGEYRAPSVVRRRRHGGRGFVGNFSNR